MAGVYLSYPFCGQKCTYCNFASGVAPRSVEREYLAALIEELRAYCWRWRPETVYLGGGSPDRIEPGALDHLLAAVPGRPWQEGTLEAAPGRITAEKAHAWRRAGITRVSLGVQSFVQSEILRTGRRHTAPQVAADVATLQATGIRSINIDLIAGLPGQTFASWRESLDWVERLGVDHVSVYMLEVDEHSRLGREILRGGSRFGAPEAPDEDMIADLYELAVERLERTGLLRYEISNFARPGRQSLHNLKYWRLEPYAGFGAGAHSFDGVRRSWNVESPAEYVGRIRRGLSPAAQEEPARLDEERLFLGLRLREGLSLAPELRRRFQAPIARFLEAGLVELSGDVLRLTRRGVLLSNEVFQEFIQT